MSAETLRQLNIERDTLLNAQRDCAWCGEHFDTLEELMVHITDMNPKDEKGNKSMKKSKEVVVTGDGWKHVMTEREWRAWLKYSVKWSLCLGGDNYRKMQVMFLAHYRRGINLNHKLK